MGGWKLRSDVLPPCNAAQEYFCKKNGGGGVGLDGVPIEKCRFCGQDLCIRFLMGQSRACVVIRLVPGILQRHEVSPEVPKLDGNHNPRPYSQLTCVIGSRL